MTTAVTRTEDVVTTTAMCMADVCIGVLATGDEFMFRRLSSTRRFHRRSSLCRLHRRASVSFFHPSFFIPKGIASRRLLNRTTLHPVSLVLTAWEGANSVKGVKSVKNSLIVK